MLKSAYDYQSAVTKKQGEMVFEYLLPELKLELGIINSGGSKEIKAELEKESPDYDRIDELAEKTTLKERAFVYTDHKSFDITEPIDFLIKE